MKIIKLTINHHNKIANNRNWMCVCVYPTFAISRFANKLKHAHSLYPSSNNNNNNNNTNRFVYSEVSAKLDLYTYPPIYRWKKNQLQRIIKHSQFLLLHILIDWRFRRSFEYDKVRQSKANEPTNTRHLNHSDVWFGGYVSMRSHMPHIHAIPLICFLFHSLSPFVITAVLPFPGQKPGNYNYPILKIW